MLLVTEGDSLLLQLWNLSGKFIFLKKKCFSFFTSQEFLLLAVAVNGSFAPSLIWRELNEP